MRSQLIRLPAALAAGLLALFLGTVAPQAAAGAAPAPRVRKNIECLNPEELSNLRYALSILQKRDPSFPDSYGYWVDVHGSFRRGPCEHGNERFLPWHRAMLFHFEDLLRKADPPRTANVTLPYWDWTLVPSGKEGYPREYEAQGPLFDDTRTPWDPGRPPFSSDEIKRILGIPTWPDFTYGLERGPHDFIHGSYVGGNMGSVPTAAQDPIFYAHHANLDRLWAQWQKDHPGQDPKDTEAPLKGMPGPPNKVGQTLKIADLGYSYGPVSCSQKNMPAGTPPRAVSDDAPAGGNVTSFPFDLPTASPERLRLLISGLRKPTDASIRVYLFLHPADVPYQAGNQEFFDRYIVANLTFWALQHKHEGQDVQAAETDLPVHLLPRQASPLRAAAAKSKWLLTMVVTPAAREEQRKGLLFHPLPFHSLSLQVEKKGKIETRDLTPSRPEEN